MVQDPHYQQYGRRKQIKALFGSTDNDAHSNQDSNQNNNPDNTFSALDQSEDDKTSASENFLLSDTTTSDDDNWIDIEPVIESVTTKMLKKQYNKLDRAQQKQWLPTDMNLWQQLSFNLDKVYNMTDLEDKLTLDRALRHFFAAQYGQKKQHLRISPHVSYNIFPKLVAARIN